MYSNQNRKLPAFLRIQHENKHRPPKHRSASSLVEEKRPSVERARGLSSTPGMNVPPQQQRLAQQTDSATRHHSKFAHRRGLVSSGSVFRNRERFVSPLRASIAANGAETRLRKKQQEAEQEDEDGGYGVDRNENGGQQLIAIPMPHHVHPDDVMDRVLVMPGFENYRKAESEYQQHARYTTRAVSSSGRPRAPNKSGNRNNFHTPLGSEYFDDDEKGPKKSIYGSTYPANNDVTRPPLSGTYPQQDHTAVGAAALWNKHAPDRQVYQSSYRSKFKNGQITAQDDDDMPRQRAAMTRDPFVLRSRAKFEQKVGHNTRVLKANQESYEKPQIPFTSTSESRSSFKPAPQDYQPAVPALTDNPPLVKKPGWEHMEVNSTQRDDFDATRAATLVPFVEMQRPAGKTLLLGDKMSKRDMVDGKFKLGDNDPRSLKTPASLSRDTYRKYVFV